MADKAYEYMDWPRIEAIVYGEEASPRDVMQPRVTEDGVLIQGFFPGTDAAEVVVGEKSYPMILEDEAGYYAVMLPLKRIPEYRFRVIRGSRKETFTMLMNVHARSRKRRNELLCRCLLQGI